MQINQHEYTGDLKYMVKSKSFYLWSNLVVSVFKKEPLTSDNVKVTKWNPAKNKQTNKQTKNQPTNQPTKQTNKQQTNVELT